ncbi:thioredoxin family protein [Sulfuricurvum sp.]|uniref:thioredoxin family protein n=1 Tax=Sulfuricurvum sp. TaxID=2025608 RepID=UPI003C4D9053
MIKIVSGILLSAAVLFGADIKWEKDLASAVERAGKEKKPLMVVVTKYGCKWCDVLKKETLKNPKVSDTLNRDFVSYEAVMEEGTVPQSLMTPGTPATWFIKGKTPMFEPIMGAVGVDDFLYALDAVKKEYAAPASKK